MGPGFCRQNLDVRRILVNGLECRCSIPVLRFVVKSFGSFEKRRVFCAKHERKSALSTTI
jgi:hypothetical protein